MTDNFPRLMGQLQQFPDLNGCERDKNIQPPATHRFAETNIAVRDENPVSVFKPRSLQNWRGELYGVVHSALESDRISKLLPSQPVDPSFSQFESFGDKSFDEWDGERDMDTPLSNNQADNRANEGSQEQWEEHQLGNISRGTSHHQVSTDLIANRPDSFIADDESASYSSVSGTSLPHEPPFNLVAPATPDHRPPKQPSLNPSTAEQPIKCIDSDADIMMPSEVTSSSAISDWMNHSEHLATPSVQDSQSRHEQGVSPTSQNSLSVLPEDVIRATPRQANAQSPPTSDTIQSPNAHLYQPPGTTHPSVTLSAMQSASPVASSSAEDAQRRSSATTSLNSPDSGNPNHPKSQPGFQAAPQPKPQADPQMEPQAKLHAEPFAKYQVEPLAVPQGQRQTETRTEPQVKPQAKPQPKLQAKPLITSTPIQPPLSSLLNHSSIHSPSFHQSPTVVPVTSDPFNPDNFKDSSTLSHPELTNISIGQLETTQNLDPKILPKPLSAPQLLPPMTHSGMDTLQDKEVDKAKQNSSMTPAPHSVQTTVQSAVHPIVQPITYSAVDSQPEVLRSQHRETAHPGEKIIPSVQANVSLGRQRQHPSPALPRSKQVASIQPPIAPTSSTIYHTNITSSSPPSPTITVTIGRIEVQVTHPTPPKPPPRSSSAQPSGPQLSLAEYLRRRNTQKRGGLA